MDDRYIWVASHDRTPFVGAVVDSHTGDTVDFLRTRSGCCHACNMLNLGVAHVEPHRTVGCRVVSNFASVA